MRVGDEVVLINRRGEAYQGILRKITIRYLWVNGLKHDIDQLHAIQVVQANYAPR